ncbi:MAG: YdcF family protein [Bacteroidota bacterium]
MFFILSKILSFLIKPMVWILLTLVYALWVKQPKRKQKSLWTALGFFFFFSNSFVANQALQWWEQEGLMMNQIPQGAYDVAILLGGYGNPYGLPQDGRFVFGGSANRLTQTLELYKTGKVKRILLTGGKSDLLQKNASEAITAREFLLRLGVPDQAILVEPDARNTRENALFSKALLDRIAHDDCLLITSAFHMPRASACFDAVGLECTPYAVDYMAGKTIYNFNHFLFPSPSAFKTWNILFKEWVGLLAYKFANYV